LDYAFAQLGLKSASEMVLTGSSAGGLSTFLHLDRVAGRMRQEASSCKTTGAPVVGYFLDAPPFDPKESGVTDPDEATATMKATQVNYPATGNYSSWMKTVCEQQNITVGALSADCLAEFPDTPHYCFMSPHMVRFVKTPFFMFNSKVDAWQMIHDLQLPCFKGDKAGDKWNCSTTEQAAIVQYATEFMTQLAPVTSSSQNGAFITSCVCHTCDWSNLNLDNISSDQHYAAWHNTLVPTSRNAIHVDPRPANGGGALDSEKSCIQFS
jgi:hypothetical protein